MVWIIFICSLLLLFLYLVLIWAIQAAWNKEKDWEIPEGFEPSTKVSVLIAARNEAKHITRCLEHLKNQSYPPHLYQIILIDDHSSDATLQKARFLDFEQLDILQLSKSEMGKKQALKKGLEHSKGELIITTDADAWVGQDWIKLYASVYELKKVKFITGPVLIEGTDEILSDFQTLDMLGSNLFTAGGIFRKWYYSANGANLAYDSKTFMSLGGYSKLELASGDDMFAIQQMSSDDPSCIYYLKNKNAAVKTDAVCNWRDLMKQRKRWATKSQAYKDHILQGVLVLISLLIFSIIFNIILGLIAFQALLKVGIFQLIAKGIFDYLLLKKSSEYFNQPFSIVKFINAFIVHIGNVILSAFWAIFKGRYEWKGRKVN